MSDQADKVWGEIVAENPNSNPTTLLNTLKQRGFKIVSIEGEQNGEQGSNHGHTFPDGSKLGPSIDKGNGLHAHLDDASVESSSDPYGPDHTHRNAAGEESGKPIPLESEENKETKDKEEKENKEADTASGFPQALRDHKESAKMIFKSKFYSLKESSYKDQGSGGPRKFRVCLIKEGAGNPGDTFFYTKDALKSAVSIFEGKKIYADHPSKTEETFDRPERSVRDVLGHFENIGYREENNQGLLEADTIVMPGESYEWARNLLAHSIAYSEKFPDKDFVGLSINAAGSTSEASIESLLSEATSEIVRNKLLIFKEKGVETMKRVDKITDAVSCDLVTEAGAGGRVYNILEGNKTMENEDAELLKTLLMKKMGEGEHDEEDSKMVMEAYEAHTKDMKEMSDEDRDSSMDRAVDTMKIAKTLAEKMVAKTQEAEGDEEGKEKTQETEDEDKTKEAEGDEDKEKTQEAEGDEEGKPKDVKESNKKKINSLNVKLTESKGEVAGLKEKLKKYELGDYLEKKLSDSKKPRAMTKSFRESLGKDLVSKKHIDASYKSFLNGVQAGSESSDNLFLETEKTSLEPAGEGQSNLDDCLVD